MSSKLKSLLSVAAPIAGTLLFPGIGTALGLGASGLDIGATGLGAIGGGLGGAAGGAIKGGGLGSVLKGAALGGAGGYLGSGGASDLFGGTAVGNTLGLTSPEGGSVFGNALGSSASSPNSLGSLLSGAGSSTGLTGADSLLGQLPSSPTSLAQGFGENAPLVSQGFGTGSGALGAIGSGFNSIAGNGAASAGIGGGASSYGGLGTLATIGGAANSLYANDQAQKDLLKAQGNSLNTLQPYLASGQAANSKLSDLLGTGAGSGASSADILAASPQYKFQLDQGNQALDRQQAAKGNYFSGGALKEAQNFGQGLANQTAQQYYGELAQQAGQGQGAANSAANIYDETGSAKANAGISSANILNQSLSSLLSGNGAKRPVNIGGQVYYM